MELGDKTGIEEECYLVHRELYHVAPNAEKVFVYLDSHETPKLESKWFEK